MAAKAAAEVAFEGAKLEGIGSDVWKELWSAARKYSEELAYKEQKFPLVQDDSICVLCHQTLSEEAKQGFTSFESYIEEETQKKAVQAEREAKQAVDSLPNIPSEEDLKPMIDAASIEKENQEIIKDLTDTLTALQGRKKKLQALDSEEALADLRQAPSCIKKIRKISQEYEESARKYETDAAEDNREELEKSRKDLKAKAWLSDRKDVILKEVDRLKDLEKIRKAKEKTSSKALSTKKGKLAETLITVPFVQRFNDELESLQASQLRVKLITKPSKGKVLHKLRLYRDTDILLTDISLNEVLSEGENRIVSIAAFLADLTGRDYPAPLVFDDPTSSLDENYEECVVQRLCSIASERQVIIFTHRLSLLNMIQDYAIDLDIEPKIICITAKKNWGTGEPGDMLLSKTEVNKALNILINDNLNKAKETFEKEEREAYDSYARGLCAKFRILLERMIECELLAGVVQRHKRAINTMGKIRDLAKISLEDCKYFEKLMTKYSRYLHSQPLEAPVALPEPDELKSDFNKLKEWREKFKDRTLKPDSEIG